jgi:hypothetical protein
MRCAGRGGDRGGEGEEVHMLQRNSRGSPGRLREMLLCRRLDRPGSTEAVLTLRRLTPDQIQISLLLIAQTPRPAPPDLQHNIGACPTVVVLGKRYIHRTLREGKLAVQDLRRLTPRFRDKHFLVGNYPILNVAL